MTYEWSTNLPGVVSVHTEDCPIRDGRECRCGTMGFRASIRDQATNVRTVSSSFPSIPEALAWKRDQVSGSRVSVGASERMLLAPVIDDFLQAAEDGLARDSRGQVYDLQRLRTIRGGLSYADSELGAMEVGEVRRGDIQRLVAQLRAAGVDGERLVGVVDGLRELYSYAVRHDLVGYSPVVELDIAGPDEDGPHNRLHPSSYDGGGYPSEPSLPTPWRQVPRHSAGHDSRPDLPTAYPYSPAAFAAEGQPNQSGMFSTPMDVPGPAPAAGFDATMQERWLWWTVRIIVIMFVLIALVLVAESV